MRRDRESTTLRAGIEIQCRCKQPDSIRVHRYGNAQRKSGLQFRLLFGTRQCCPPETVRNAGPLRRMAAVPARAVVSALGAKSHGRTLLREPVALPDVWGFSKSRGSQAAWTLDWLLSLTSRKPPQGSYRSLI